VRLAIGGSRTRILQQLLIESLMIAVLGSLAAMAVAKAAARSIPALISTAVDRIHLDVALDWRIFGFTAAAGIITALIFGTAPAIRATRSSLRTPGRSAASNDGLALRRGLVAVQVAVTLVLLFTGLLFVRTFRNLSTLDTGIRADGIVQAIVFFSERTYPEDRKRAAYPALDRELASLPGVEGLSDAHATPLGGSFWDPDIVVGGEHKGSSYGNRIGAGYFRTLGTPLLAGRDFDGRDAPGAPLVAIVNQSFAARFLTGDPIGQRFTLPSDSTSGAGITYEVIGLVADQKYGDMREVNPRIFYVPSVQEPLLPPTRRYVVRSSRSAASTIAAIGAVVSRFDPSLAVRYSVLETQIADALLQERLMARLSTLFGGVALLLAIVGLYGVMSYTVASRRAEIGVRVALGATRVRIVSMIMNDVARMMLAGVVLGTAAALVAARGIRSLLFGLEPDDPLTLLVAIAALVVTGVVAALWPAKRATGIDPLSALREN
jgi:predicted permease